MYFHYLTCRISTAVQHVVPLFLMFLVSGLGWFGGRRAQASQPNIVVLYSDDHTAQAIGDYQGNLDYGLRLNHSPTPNIDRLAEEGMRFDNAFVTNSICKPSRAVLLTGLHNHLNGVPTNFQSIPKEMPTFPSQLQEAGYQTAIVGKWHLGTAPQGFDYYEVLHGQGPYYNPTMRRNGENVSYTGHTSEIITDRTLRWFKQRRNKDRPFMLMMNHKAPHRNWLPSPYHLNDYDDRTLPEPDSLFYDYEGLSFVAKQNNLRISEFMSWGWDLKFQKAPGGRKAEGWNRLVDTNDLTEAQKQQIIRAYADENQRLREQYDDMPERERTRWKYQRYVKDYLRVIRGIDDSVGRLMNYLEQTGLAEETIVVYSADQGFFLGENGWFDKRWIYEESLRQPLIVRWPGTVEADSVNDDLVQNLDFAPTLLDVAGVEVPERMQGRSLVPLLKGKTPDDWRDAVYYHYYEENYGIPAHYGLRTDRYTLAHYYNEDEWELFDLKKDPEQLQNVYDDSDYAETRRRLKKKLSRLQKKYKDTEPEQDLKDIVTEARKDAKNVKMKEVKLQKVLHLNSGQETPPQTLNPSGKPITVGAWVESNAPNGTIISRGGASHGYILYLDDRTPVFGIRSFRQLKLVKADQKVNLDTPVHLAGVLDANKQLHMYVNGRRVNSAEGDPIAVNPNDDVDVGSDGGSQVGPQSGSRPFNGRLRDIRVYWGALSPEQIKEWATTRPPFNG